MIGLDGVVRARQSGEDREIGQNVSFGTLFSYQRQAEEGYYISESDISGIRRIFSYQAMTDYPLILVVGVSEADALAEFYNRRDKYYVAAGVVSLFIAGAIGVLIRMILARQRAKSSNTCCTRYQKQPVRSMIREKSTSRFIKRLVN